MATSTASRHPTPCEKRAAESASVFVLNSDFHYIITLQPRTWNCSTSRSHICRVGGCGKMERSRHQYGLLGPIFSAALVSSPITVYNSYCSWFFHQVALSCGFSSLVCPTLFDPVDWSLPVSCVHGLFQGRILEWVTMHQLYSNKKIFFKVTVLCL